MRLTWYVTDKREYLASLKDIGAPISEIIGRHYPAMALVQVVALVEDRAKVEIEATAVVPERRRADRRNIMQCLDHRTFRHLHPRQPAAAGSVAGDRCWTGFDYPDWLNAAVELTDRMVERGFGDHIALIGNGRQRTYKELTDWSNRIAHALVEDYGVKPGNRVLIRSANNPAMVACWLAATKAGAVVVNTMPMLRAGELAQIVDKARDQPCAVRHAADGRAGRLRQGHRAS